MMKSFATIVNAKKSLATVAKFTILGACGVPGYASDLSEHGYKKNIDYVLYENSKALSFL